MKTGDRVIWERLEYTILAEYDSEFVYIAAVNSAQLVAISELVPA